MLYTPLKWLFYLTTKAYFRSLTISGKDFIPKSDTPILFAANHPSSFMDSILLGAHIKRSLFFLARGAVFKNKLLRPAFNQLYMIPVYKADLSPGQLHKNAGTFEKCHQHFGQNKTILIFPEGVSKTERRLRPIKTGTARIALGAEEKHNFELGLAIIPIGLNYSDPHLFKSDVLVNFGEPIQVSDYKNAFIEDPREAVLQLTELIKFELEKRIVFIENDQLEKTIEQIETLYRGTLRAENSTEEKGTQDFRLSQDIAKAVVHYAKHEPAILKNFEHKISTYVEDLDRSQLRDTQIRSSSIRFFGVRRLLYFLIGLPFFLFGFITNFIPFKLTGFIGRKIKIREDFVGAITIAVGLIVFLIFYGIEAFVMASYTNNILGMLFFLVLYPTGVFCINYMVTYYKLRQTFKYITLFMRKSNLIASLKTTKEELIEELEKRKAEYLKLQAT